jgi:hypothetical protein
LPSRRWRWARDDLIVVLVLVVSLGIGVGTLRLVSWSPRRPELANDDDSQIADRTAVTLTGTVRISASR